MRLARVLGAIGRALISAGVIVLLFVAYQLWGTGIQHAQAQDSLEDDFTELLESDLATEAQDINEAVEAVNEEAAENLDDADSGEALTPAQSIEVDLSDIEYSPQFLSVLYPEEGSSLARIVIPDINVDQIVVEGVSVEDLRKGPGHYGSTPNPGQAGNSAIAGHRTTYGAPFHRVDELEPGAEIFVTTIQGTFVYRVRGNDAPDGSVKGYFIVSPSQTEVLDQTGENLLTLTACHPKYSARQRIIVQAELVGEPAVTIPREDAREIAPVDISSGAEDERAGASADEELIISDAVAADDDPSVDADGTPLDEADEADEADVAETDVADDEAASDEDTAVAAAGTTDSEPPAETEEVELTAAQTPFDEETDFGEGLNGDRSKIGPAVLWGLASLAIWMAASFIGKRLNRRWTLYAVGLAPYALVLWACFVNVDQALPSY